MSLFFDVCLTRLISYAISDFSLLIDGASRCYENRHHLSVSINKFSSAIIPVSSIVSSNFRFSKVMDKLINDESYEYKPESFSDPWWFNSYPLDKHLYPLDDVILYYEKGRYYPVFHSFTASDICRGEITFSVKTEAADIHKEKKPTCKEIISRCAEFLDLVEKGLTGCSDSNYGNITTRGGGTNTWEVKTGTTTVSRPTGNYKVDSDWNFGLTPNYTVRAEYTTERVNTYKTVCETAPTYTTIHQYYWLLPLDSDEEKCFSTVLHNQTKIKSLAEEYSMLGLFTPNKKRELFETFDRLLKYSKLIVSKAIVRRIGFDFYEKDEQLIDKAIESEQQRLEQQQSMLKRTALTAFKKRKDTHNAIRHHNNNLNALNKTKNKMQERIKQIKEVFEELEKRLSATPI